MSHDLPHHLPELEPGPHKVAWLVVSCFLLAFVSSSLHPLAAEVLATKRACALVLAIAAALPLMTRIPARRLSATACFALASRLVKLAAVLRRFAKKLAGPKRVRRRKRRAS